MQSKPSIGRQSLIIVGASLGWLAIILQLYLIIINRTASIPETVIRFFSFFTILTNILTAMCFTHLLLKPGSKWGLFFSKPASLAAITVYIAVVGLIYNVILRFLWQPHGLQLIIDELLHSVVPVIFILYWVLYVPKRALHWSNILPWLIYPLIYCIYILVRGAIAGFYPYPFIDVNVLGYSKVFLNIAAIVVVFIVLSVIVIAVGKINKPGSGSKTSHV